MKQALLLGLLISAAAQAQVVRLRVFLNDRPVGTANVNQKLMKDGAKRVDLEVVLASGTKQVTVRTESAYDVLGNPVRKHQTVAEGVKSSRRITVTFDREGATVVRAEEGPQKRDRVPLVASGFRTVVSEFWFLRDTPAEGQTEKTYVFNVDTLRWDLTSITYIGMQTATVAGHKVTGHLVVSEGGEHKTSSLLDDRGLPYLIEDGPLRMERAFDD